MQGREGGCLTHQARILVQAQTRQRGLVDGAAPPSRQALLRMRLLLVLGASSLQQRRQVLPPCALGGGRGLVCTCTRVITILRSRQSKQWRD